MDKLNNKIDVLDTKLKYANGYEKLEIINQQIKAYKELQQQETISLSILKQSESEYKSI